MLRIGLFLATNLAVLLMLSIAGQVLLPFLPESFRRYDLAMLLLYSAAIGFTGSLVSLILSKTLALKSVRAMVIKKPSNPTERFLAEQLAELAKISGIKTPQLALYPSQAPNAFASGWGRNHSVVAVSTGLVNSLTPQQIRAVLAHEVAHISNGDMVTMAMIQGVVNTFVLFFARIAADFVARIVSLNTYKFVYVLVYMSFQLVFGLFASIIVLSFSRMREYRADEGGAALVGAPVMSEALIALSNVSYAMPRNIQAFGIVGLRGLFSTHPKMENRLRNLKRWHDKHQ